MEIWRALQIEHVIVVGVLLMLLNDDGAVGDELVNLPTDRNPFELPRQGTRIQGLYSVAPVPPLCPCSRTRVVGGF